MDVMEMLADAGAVYDGKHFVYKSGKHGPAYINADMIFPDVYLLKQLCYRLARPYWKDVDVVVGPATGGIPLAYLTALALGDQADCPAVVWADQSGGDFLFARAGFSDRLKNTRVLVVEDLLTTGGSVAKVCQQAIKHGAYIVGVSAICNRGGVTANDLGVKRLSSLAEVNFVAHEAHLCPLCEALQPIVTDIGHGAEFRHGNPNYLGGYTTLLS